MTFVADLAVDFATFTEGVLRTESRVALGLAVEDARVLHAAMGIATEAGELLDSLKKHLFYGKPLDETNLKEEIGDAMFYVAVLCDSLKLSMSDVLATNTAKLRARYPQGFTQENALNRDLDNERKVLEQRSEEPNAKDDATDNTA